MSDINKDLYGKHGKLSEDDAKHAATEAGVYGYKVPSKPPTVETFEPPKLKEYNPKKSEPVLK